MYWQRVGFQITGNRKKQKRRTIRIKTLVATDEQTRTWRKRTRTPAGHICRTDDNPSWWKMKITCVKLQTPFVLETLHYVRNIFKCQPRLTTPRNRDCCLITNEPQPTFGRGRVRTILAFGHPIGNGGLHCHFFPGRNDHKFGQTIDAPKWRKRLLAKIVDWNAIMEQRQRSRNTNG